MSRFFNVKWLPEIGVKSSKKSFHSLRHTFANELKQAGVSEQVASELLGHASQSITYGRYANESRIDVLKERYAKYDWVNVGYSGHEIGFSASLLAARKGVSMIERHFTLSRDFNIHHIGAAITPEQYSSMVNIAKEMDVEDKNPLSDKQAGEDEFLVNRDYV